MDGEWRDDLESGGWRMEDGDGDILIGIYNKTTLQ